MNTILESYVPSLPTLEERADIVSTFWRMFDPSHSALICTLYRTTAGLELRARYDQGDLVRAASVDSEVEAAVVAARWKRIAAAVGSFVDLEAGAYRAGSL